MSLSERIKAIRSSRDMTQAMLGERMMLTQQSIAAWETGRATPSPDQIVAMVKMFDISADYLLGLTDDPTPRTAAQQQLAEDLAASGDAVELTDEELAARLPDDVREGVMALLRLAEKQKP